jgi:hypothetical protein
MTEVRRLTQAWRANFFEKSRLYVALNQRKSSLSVNFRKIIQFNMFDLKVINSVLAQLEEERGIPKEKILEAIELALGTAYKKEYGKKGQIIKASFNPDAGDVEFWQSKIVVDRDSVLMEEDIEKMEEAGETVEKDSESINYLTTVPKTGLTRS